MATAGARETAEQAGEQHLREGCRIELTGLSSEGLNGQRGGISGSYLAAQARWPVVVDGTGSVRGETALRQPINQSSPLRRAITANSPIFECSTRVSSQVVGRCLKNSNSSCQRQT